jgi:hypothetical protein
MKSRDFYEIFHLLITVKKQYQKLKNLLNVNKYYIWEKHNQNYDL